MPRSVRRELLEASCPRVGVELCELWVTAAAAGTALCMHGRRMRACAEGWGGVLGRSWGLTRGG